MALVKVEQLAKYHDRTSFDCGKDPLNTYLKSLASQHAKVRFAATYVAVEEGNETRILGYVSISMGSVLLQDADESVFAKLPKHPMPVLHVGRLATDLRYVGKGIGSMLLSHAADVAIEASKSVGVYALELDAKDEEAFQYYLRRGFLPLRADSTRLYGPLKTLIEARGPDGS